MERCECRRNRRRQREVLTMKIRDSVAFVTGANRGLGLVFAQELLAAGARKVYAAARNPEHIPLQGAVRVPLDVTAPNAIAAAARECPDVDLLINNAGICHWGQGSFPWAPSKPPAQKWRPTTSGRSWSVVPLLRCWRTTAGAPSSTFFPS